MSGEGIFVFIGIWLLGLVSIYGAILLIPQMGPVIDDMISDDTGTYNEEGEELQRLDIVTLLVIGLVAGIIALIPIGILFYIIEAQYNKHVKGREKWFSAALISIPVSWFIYALMVIPDVPMNELGAAINYWIWGIYYAVILFMASIWVIDKDLSMNFLTA